MDVQKIPDHALKGLDSRIWKFHQEKAMLPDVPLTHTLPPKSFVRKAPYTDAIKPMCL